MILRSLNLGGDVPIFNLFMDSALQGCMEFTSANIIAFFPKVEGFL